MQAKRQHYGIGLSPIGSRVNWNGSRYTVVGLYNIAGITRDQVGDPSYCIATYHCRRFRGNGGSALYELRQYADGTFSSPRRIKEQDTTDAF